MRLSAFFGNFLHSLQKKTQLQAGTSVDVSMRTMESFRKPDIKKDARLTIRIPRELKDRIDSIDLLYGVALPKIANECLRAFCDHVEQKKQTPTFPLTIGPCLGGEIRLATDRFAGAEEFKSLTGTKRNNEYKNIVDFGADRGFCELRVGG